MPYRFKNIKPPPELWDFPWDFPQLGDLVIYLLEYLWEISISPHKKHPTGKYVFLPFWAWAVNLILHASLGWLP